MDRKMRTIIGYVSNGEAPNDQPLPSQSIDYLALGASSGGNGNESLSLSLVPPPADNCENLDHLLTAPGLDKTLLACKGSTVMETVRRIIRRLLRRELAQLFSMTGMGTKRAHNKLCFQDHLAWKIVTGKSRSP